MPNGFASRGVVLAVGAISIAAIIVALTVAWSSGLKPLDLLSGGSPVVVDDQPAAKVGPPTDDEEGQFVAVILADTEDTWGRIFKQGGYAEPTLVLFSGQVASACGLVSTASGPFYCSSDEKMYFDLSFFDSPDNGTAMSDMAIAYAVARNVGYHVLNLLGILSKVDGARQRASPAESDRLSLMLELQADCLAGVWAHDANARDLLEVGDVDQLLTTAAQSGGGGSSDDRANWFRRGYEQGRLDGCDTFGPRE